MYTSCETSMSSISINEPSIFISHVFPNKAECVYDTFAELFGEKYIDDVDIVTHTFNGHEVCRVYVHFKMWPTEPKFQRLRTRLLNGETVQIVYDEPWYWKCVASKLPRITSNGGMTSSPKKRIVLDDEKPTMTATKTVTKPSTTQTKTSSTNDIRSSWVEKVKAETVETEKKTDIEETTTSTETATQTATETETKSAPKTETETNTDAETETTNKSVNAIFDIPTMQKIHYEYSCFIAGGTLKTKADFMNYLGDFIFMAVDKISPTFSNKITGMMLENEPEILVNAIEDKTLFGSLLMRCYVCLQEALVSDMTSLMTM